MLISEDKWNPVCPNCGSDLEPTTTNDGTAFACAQCDWNDAQARKKIQKQILYGAAFVLVGMFLLSVAALTGGGASKYIYVLPVATAVWAATSWKPWRGLRKLNASRSTHQTESPLGFSCAPASFMAPMPPTQEAQDLFGNVLSGRNANIVPNQGVCFQCLRLFADLYFAVLRVDSNPFVWDMLQD
jgi:hypothetical protein